MERIYQSAVKLMAPLTLEEVCKKSIQEACVILDAKYGSIFWNDGGVLKRVYTNIPVKQQLEPRAQGNSLEVFFSKKPKFLAGADISHYTALSNSPVKSITLIPLYYADKSLGVMGLQATHRTNYLKTNLQRVLLFSSFVSLAIRNVQLYEQKKEALNQRDLFMSLASHELKTPLAVIVMTLHMIERKHAQGVFNTKWLETIRRNSHKLKVLIDDLFSMSQISAGTIRLRPQYFSLAEMCHSVIAETKSIYPHHIELVNKAQSIHRMNGDEEKVRLVVTNIVGNAAKFSPPDTTITISLQPKWSGVEIKVRDRGVGIDNADQELVFERYFQGKNRGNGLGLGLFVAREIVQAHGGTITLTSKKNKGTTVSLWLPVAAHA